MSTLVLKAALYSGQDMGQPKCPSIDEWINKMLCTYTMEYYTAIRKNEIVPFAATWMDLEIIILSEVSQTKKKYIAYSTYIWNLKNELINKTELS